MKYVSIDMESTGLNADEHDIIEFGAVVDDLSNLRPLKSLPTFHCYFTKANYTGSPFALSMHPEIFRRIAEKDMKKYNFFSAMKFGNSFKKFLMHNGYRTERDKVLINVAGKNFGSCDLQFLNKKTDLSKHVDISHKILDPAILFVEQGDINLPGLGKCKERMGLKEEVDHTAVADALDVVKLLRFTFKDMFVPQVNNGHEPYVVIDEPEGKVYVCAKCGLGSDVWNKKKCVN